MIITMILAILIPLSLILMLFAILDAGARSDEASERYIDIEFIEQPIKEDAFQITYNPHGKYWIYHYFERGLPTHKTFFNFKDLQNFTKEREKEK